MHGTNNMCENLARNLNLNNKMYFDFDLNDINKIKNIDLKIFNLQLKNKTFLRTC